MILHRCLKEKCGGLIKQAFVLHFWSTNFGNLNFGKIGIRTCNRSRESSSSLSENCCLIADFFVAAVIVGFLLSTSATTFSSRCSVIEPTPPSLLLLPRSPQPRPARFGRTVGIIRTSCFSSSNERSERTKHDFFLAKADCSVEHSSTFSGPGFESISSPSGSICSSDSADADSLFVALATSGLSAIKKNEC